MIGSIGGRLSGPMLGGYGAAKHGLVGLSSSLRAELAPFKIKVVLIEPGAIATPIWDRGQAAGEELQSRRPREQCTLCRQIETAAKMARRVPAQDSILRSRPRSSLRHCRARILHRGRWSAGRPK